MTRNPSGMFKQSVKCVAEVLRQNTLFRNWGMAIVLLAAAAGVPLALAGPEAQADAKTAFPWIIGLALQPMEFLLYDVILMVKPAKTSMRAMLLDSRLPAYFWRIALLLFLPLYAPLELMTKRFFPLLLAKATPDQLNMFFAMVLCCWIILLPPLLRSMFFPVVLAAGRPNPMRTSFRETKGKLWRIFRASFLPMLLCLGGMELLDMLQNRCILAGGFAYAASWPLTVAGIAFLNAIITAFFAIVYRRIVEPARPGPVLVPAGRPSPDDDARVAGFLPPGMAQSLRVDPGPGRALRFWKTARHGRGHREDGMTRQPRLLDQCLRGAWDALNAHAPLRRCVLGTVLGLTLLCVALAAFGVTLGTGDAGGAYSPRLFALLFLPAEFYVYDLFLGQKPRAGLAMYRDMRLARFLLAGFKISLAGVALAGLALLPGFIVLGLLKGAGGSVLLAVGLVAVIWILLFGVLGGYLVRFMFLPVVVALGLEKPLTHVWRVTAGKTWRLTKALFVPYGALVAVSIGVEIVGPALERSLGFVALAPWFLADACLTGFISCAAAALLVLVYRREVEPDGRELTGTPGT